MRAAISPGFLHGRGRLEIISFWPAPAEESDRRQYGADDYSDRIEDDDDEQRTGPEGGQKRPDRWTRIGVAAVRYRVESRSDQCLTNVGAQSGNHRHQLRARPEWGAALRDRNVLEDIGRRRR